MIKRFRYDFKSGIVADGKGDFISYAEYEELQQKLVAVTEQRDALVVENSKARERHIFIRALAVSILEHSGGRMDWRGAMEDASELIKTVDEVYASTPATSSAIAALRAEAQAEVIPEGYVLVPQEMHLPSESMEGICVHCGDGGHQFGEFTDGTLFVGEVDYGDGKKVYGLHIATAEYPEEGCSTICEFARQLRESKGEVQS